MISASLPTEAPGAASLECRALVPSPEGRLRIVAARGDIVARPETPADSLRERERLASMAPLELYMADYNRVIAVQTGFCPCAAAP